ncbi:hypothetical protein ACTI_64920 [Actinoplanes sp. OR16]|uniref:hypothetical protein n=1 Tax=Actinoplanes sp. OR16 TaxID=946334 RepID=UPI000F708EDC|nr:hypothetical protein [Actinoplanes sp. OR16]BBH69807.1 hypothetical protein ACTI_64920 [Actinoplanes sp. OR16]
MSADRRRVAAVVATFALVLMAGVVWLVRTATGHPASSAGGGTAISAPASPPPSRVGATSSARAGDPTGGTRPGEDTQPPGEDTTGPDDQATRSGDGPLSTATPPGTPGTPGNGDQAGEPTGGGGDPPAPMRSVRINGPLGGGPMDDSCRMFQNAFGVPLTVESVGLASADDGMTLDYEHCPAKTFASVDAELQPCRPSARISAGHSCYTGAELDEDKRLPPGSGENRREYEAVARIVFTAQCVSTEVTPCSEEAVTLLSPSAGEPVVVTWEATATAPFRRIGRDDRTPDPAGSPP